MHDRKKSYSTQYVYIYLLYKLYLEYFSFQEELSKILSWSYVGLHVKYLLFLLG